MASAAWPGHSLMPLLLPYPRPGQAAVAAYRLPPPTSVGERPSGRRDLMRKCTLAVAGSAAVFAAGLVVVGSGPAGAGGPLVQKEYPFTGAEDEFVVPADVCEIEVDAIGARGGGLVIDNDAAPLGAPTTRGLGGEGLGTLAGAPGETPDGGGAGGGQSA